MQIGISKAWKKAYKRMLEVTGKIRCGRCPYNRNENNKRSPRTDKYKNIDRKTIRKKS